MAAIAAGHETAERGGGGHDDAASDKARGGGAGAGGGRKRAKDDDVELDPGSSRSAAEAATACRIRVIARMRPLSAKEEEAGGAVDDSQIRILNDTALQAGKQVFTFDAVLGPAVTQRRIHELVGSAAVSDVLKGYNSTIFAYGQTGSGKTYTMYGEQGAKGRPWKPDKETRGVVPRCVNAMFRRIRDRDEDDATECTIKVSFLEIYNEQVRDLLNPKKGGLRIRENARRGVWVEGISAEFATQEADVFHILRAGSRNRHVSRTNMNDYSSRSHCVLIIHLTQSLPDGSSKVSQLNLVDLAGSERVLRTGAAGTTLDEAKSINQSLSALGNCIHALTTEGRPHIPYRDSRLTHLLKESLGGNTKTVLFVTGSLAAANADETVSTLRFGRSAKAIKNTVRINTQLSYAQLTAKLDALVKYVSLVERENASLKAALKGAGVEADGTASAAGTSRESTPLDDLAADEDLVTSGDAVLEVGSLRASSNASTGELAVGSGAMAVARRSRAAARSAAGEDGTEGTVSDDSSSIADSRGRRSPTRAHGSRSSPKRSGSSSSLGGSMRRSKSGRLFGRSGGASGAKTGGAGGASTPYGAPLIGARGKKGRGRGRKGGGRATGAASANGAGGGVNANGDWVDGPEDARRRMNFFVRLRLDMEDQAQTIRDLQSEVVASQSRADELEEEARRAKAVAAAGEDRLDRLRKELASAFRSASDAEAAQITQQSQANATIESLERRVEALTAQLAASGSRGRDSAAEGSLSAIAPQSSDVFAEARARRAARTSSASDVIAADSGGTGQGGSHARSSSADRGTAVVAPEPVEKIKSIRDLSQHLRSRRLHFLEVLQTTEDDGDGSAGTAARPPRAGKAPPVVPTLAFASPPAGSAADSSDGASEGVSSRQARSVAEEAGDDGDADDDEADFALVDADIVEDSHSLAAASQRSNSQNERVSPVVSGAGARRRTPTQRSPRVSQSSVDTRMSGDSGGAAHAAPPRRRGSDGAASLGSFAGYISPRASSAGVGTPRLQDENERLRAQLRATIAQLTKQGHRIRTLESELSSAAERATAAQDIVAAAVLHSSSGENSDGDGGGAAAAREDDAARVTQPRRKPRIVKPVRGTAHSSLIARMEGMLDDIESASESKASARSGGSKASAGVDSGAHRRSPGSGGSSSDGVGGATSDEGY